MGPSAYIGRVGGLAAALGVGAALFLAPAWADSGTGTAAAGDSGASQPQTRRGDASQTRPSGRSDSSTGPSSVGRPRGPLAPQASASASDLTQINVARRNRGDNTGATPAPAASASAATAAPAPAVSPAPAAASIAVKAESIAAPAASLSGKPLQNFLAAHFPALNPDVVKPQVSTVLASVADHISTVVSNAVARIASALASSPFGAALDTPLNWLMLAFARKQQPAATTLATSAAAVGQQVPTVLTLNGYKVVATSIEDIKSFYGQYTYWPGVSSTTQGTQNFALVDPTTQQTTGNFSALIEQGDPTSLGTQYVELLVTGNDGTNVGAGAGQTPPIGSIISSWTALNVFGWTYSSMPTSPTTDKVTFKAVTPFGSIPIPFPYDAAKGVANHTFDNKPINVTSGFSIVPANPVGETLKATSGLLPLFNSIQGEQRYNVVDSNGASVGSFQGDFTTTGDVLGITTEALRVTANDGINVGTGPGQVPPVDTVYNVAYLDLLHSSLLYSSKPTVNGTVIETVLTTPLGSLKVPFKFNASVEPAMKLLAPGSKQFVATSAQLPAGVNGLPPRDVQIQGYQQFDVLNSAGTKIGSVDADVVAEWDGLGIHSKSLLITNVTSGTPGADAGNVPTVGTVVNFINFGSSSLGISDSVTPIDTGEVRAFQIITPLGVIPLTPSTVPVGRPVVTYYDPFAP